MAKRQAVRTRLEDLKLATRTIGDTTAARLAWVIRFIGEDPAAWHPAVATAHGDCLQALARGGIPDNLMGGVELPEVLTPGDVAGLHAELRATVRDLLSKNPLGANKVTIPTEGDSESLVRLTQAGKKPALFASGHGHTSARTAVFQGVKDLIVQAGDRLIACPACGKPFIALRKQEYCSTSCAQRARNERREANRPRKTDRKTRRAR
jgi:hypothetical protein